MVSRKVSRRRFVASTAALSAVGVAAPFVRGAYAAGKLSVGFWDHWVPNANGATETLIKEWAEKEKVEIRSTSSPPRATSCCSPPPPNCRPSRATTSWR